jgi:predicted amidophosphoribosyltransferase
MSKKKKGQSSFNAAKSLQRKLAAGQGFYDGRFRSRVKKDKKKEESKRKARRRIGPREVE